MTAGCPGRHARVGEWYDEAVVCAAPVFDRCSDAPTFAGLHDLASRLDELQASGVTCLRLVPVEALAHTGAAPRGEGPVTDLALARSDAFQRFLSLVNSRGMRLLVDVGRRPAADLREWKAHIAAARAWCGEGADGVVLYRPALMSIDHALVARAAPFAHALGDLDDDRWFLLCDEVPIPIRAVRAATLQRALFRAHLVPTLEESLRTQSGAPLLGLVIRLALGIVRGDLAIFAPHAATEPLVQQASSRFHGGRAQVELGQRLLLGLPGPPQITLGELSNRPDSPLRALICTRADCPALTGGSAAPVSLGAGPTVALLRELAGQTALLVANFSAERRPVVCDLGGYEGRLMVDMLRGRSMGRVSSDTVPLPLEAYACEWLGLVAV